MSESAPITPSQWQSMLPVRRTQMYGAVLAVLDKRPLPPGSFIFTDWGAPAPMPSLWDYVRSLP